MNLPSSTTATSTSASSDAAADSTERCDDCGSLDAWVIHTVKLRGSLRFFCTHCLLRNHPTSFCPSCFAFYDSSPPTFRRVACSNSKCPSLTHIHCAGDADPPSSYLCPPCLNPTSFSFFRPIVDANGSRSVDKSLSNAFLCAAKIAASSMNKAVMAAKCDADRRGREAALAKKRAREALEHVVMLDAKEKARSVVPKLKEASVDQKPKLSPASNGGTVKETESSATTTTTTTTTSTKNNGGSEKQNPATQLAKVKQEADASR